MSIALGGAVVGPGEREGPRRQQRRPETVRDPVPEVHEHPPSPATGHRIRETNLPAGSRSRKIQSFHLQIVPRIKPETSATENRDWVTGFEGTWPEPTRRRWRRRRRGSSGGDEELEMTRVSWISWCVARGHSNPTGQGPRRRRARQQALGFVTFIGGPARVSMPGGSELSEI
jgi:hypothetical protein